MKVQKDKTHIWWDVCNILDGVYPQGVHFERTQELWKLEQRCTSCIESEMCRRAEIYRNVRSRVLLLVHLHAVRQWCSLASRNLLNDKTSCPRVESSRDIVIVIGQLQHRKLHNGSVYSTIRIARFNQLLLIQPTTNAKWSLNRRDNNSSNDTRRCWCKPTFPFMATDWRWCWRPKRL